MVWGYIGVFHCNLAYVGVFHCNLAYIDVFTVIYALPLSLHSMNTVRTATAITLYSLYVSIRLRTW